MPRSATRDLLLLVYTPREDSNRRGYEDWLRTVDNPFFNGVRGIRHYTNWKIVSAADCAVPYTHFDLMFLDNAAAKDAVWANPKVMAFAQGWTEAWGRYPNATPETMHMNYAVFLCSNLSGGDRVSSRAMAFMPGNDALAGGPDDQVFAVDEAILGDIRFQRFTLRYLPSERDFAAIAAAPPPGATGCALGRLIAAPDIPG
jgi:hypothetical protein